MRALVLALLLVAACGGSSSPPIDASLDSDLLPACAPNGTCTAGPPCGADCCATGEQCVQGVCQCGDGPACGVGDTCAAPGPVGGDQCGSICCGASGPCPQ